MALLAIFGFCQTCSADLVGYWSFDEGSGEIAKDRSGNGNDGTLENGTEWTGGKFGDAVQFDGSDDYVDVGNAGDLSVTGDVTFSMWVKISEYPTSWRNMLSKLVDDTHTEFNFRYKTSTEGQFYYGTGSAAIICMWNPSEDLPLNTWTHIAGVRKSNAYLKLYFNGVEKRTSNITTAAVSTEANVTIGRQSNAIFYFNGIIDEVAIFAEALGEAEIQSAMSGVGNRELASKPNLANEAVDVPRDTGLSWNPGEFAVKHDVYLGTTFEDVDNADTANPLNVLASQGQSATTFDPGRLDFGQTYYWRVDEVNGAPDNTVFKGDIWSFTAEPFSIPVETIVVTASSSNDETMVPENTINASGLDELDQHSTQPTDMWLSATGDQDVWIQYEFDQARKLDKLLVWNANQLIEAFVGLGVKEVVIQISEDGETWAILEDVSPFNQATGSTSYTANTTVDFAGVLAKYVKINVQSGYGPLGQFGLSEVRFLFIPTYVREPQPADGEAVEGVDVVLNWRAGREAAAHEVRLGTDPADLALAATTDAPSFLAEDLDYDQTYYWQIVEINEAEMPSAYTGPVWRITTPAYGTVDDFDQYDDDCRRIFFAWEDGLGHNGGDGIEGCDEPASNGNGGGSIVGNATAPFAEQMIVYAGTQSMPLEYDNAFGASEATLTLPSQDWTASGIKSLSLYVFGAADNSGQLYLKINNTRVDGAPDISQAGWQPWSIDLSTVGGNLQNVTSLTFGIDGANAAGKLYLDEIHLYPQVRESTASALSYVKITSDEDCGISTDNSYTHKLDFGTGSPGAMINGVQFDAYNAAANGTLNFMRESSSGGASEHGGNGNHNVTGSLVDLLTDMYYNGNNAPGGTTTWTLSGLSAGQTYHTRIYTRQWGASDSRNVTFVFDPDGAGPISDSTGKVSQDNAMSTGFANGNDAYYINYQFTAVAGEDLVITLTQDNLNYSWHLYGLTNQEVAGE